MEHNSSTGFSTNLDLAAGWLHDCANYHEHCRHQPQMESILPYRVLDIGNWENLPKFSSQLAKTGSDHMLRSATAGANPKDNTNTSQQMQILSSGRKL